MQAATSPSVDYFAFDFDAPPSQPDYVVEGLIERTDIAMLVGDTGTAKTFLGLAAVVAGVSGQQWLGRDVFARRFLVVDEENTPRVIASRLRALGMTNDHRDALRYAIRQGAAIGSDEWNKWLRRELHDHEADLCLIDGAMAASNVQDVNDNSAVVRFLKGLKVIAEAERCAIVVYHHERKRQVGQTRAAGQSTMGARQWANQPDVHLELTLDDRTTEPMPNEGRKLRTTVLLGGVKIRDDIPAPRELLAVTSEKDCAGRLLWAKVESEGPAEAKRSKTELLTDAIVAVLHERGATARAAELADALGEKVGGTFSSALSAAVETGGAVQVKRGVYAPAAGPDDAEI